MKISLSFIDGHHSAPDLGFLAYLYKDVFQTTYENFCDDINDLRSHFKEDTFLEKAVWAENKKGIRIIRDNVSITIYVHTTFMTLKNKGYMVDLHKLVSELYTINKHLQNNIYISDKPIEHFRLDNIKEAIYRATL